jgi:hypothetical protein
MTAPQPHRLEPWPRIDAAGCDIRVSYAERCTKYRVCLTHRDGSAIACRVTSRSGKHNLTQATARVKAGGWRPASAFYATMVELADLAEMHGRGAR